MPAMTARRQRGFTLIEVMLALAILGLGLTLLVKSLASNVTNANDAQMMGIVAELARGKMYDVEEVLRKDGFQETDQSSNGDFSDEGWSSVTWESKVEIPEIPGLAAMKAMQGEPQPGDPAATGDAGVDTDTTSSSAITNPMGTLASSGLGGMMSMFGLGAGGGGSEAAADQAGDAFILQYFDMIQQVLKASVRKVTLTVRYEVTGQKRDLEIVAYFTDDSAMEKALFMLSAVEEDPPQ